MSDELTYADAGVDLEAAERSVALMRASVERTRRPEVLGSIGGFGGLFSLAKGRYRDPVLVSGADGVGSKVELARRLDRLDTIGQDLVAMVVDDLVVSGAEPLFMNDYLAVGRLDAERVARIVGGIAEGCVIAGCALVGGETAEHPGLLEEDAFDLAGFGVAVVERDALLGPDRVAEGDVLIAMPSSGLHANGFSLVRRIIEGVDLRTPVAGQELGEALLTPTRIHSPDCLALNAEVGVHAFSHITGGGLTGNLPRSLPEGLAAQVDLASWRVPELQRWLAEQGPVGDEELRRVFNAGVGMVAVVAADAAPAALDLLASRGVDAWRLGMVVQRPAGSGGVVHTGA